MSPCNKSQYFLDSQWAKHYPELLHLVCRKLGPYLSSLEQQALRTKLCRANQEHHEHVDHSIIVTFDAPESYMRAIYGKFGVDTLPQLVRYAVFTAEEEIKIFVKS